MQRTIDRFWREQGIMKWNTTEQLEDLLCEVVNWESRTSTEGEISFAHKIDRKSVV